MTELIHFHDNMNKPLVNTGHALLKRTYFNIIKLAKDQSYQGCLPGYESVYVVIHGKCRLECQSKIFADIGQRESVWSGKADSVYVPPETKVSITAKTDVEILVAGGVGATSAEPFRILPDDVDMVDVGSPQTHSHRRIYHILGASTAGESGRLLVSELYADEGCWSGYPPHKHDTDISDTQENYQETAFEEIYHYRFQPDTGFGGQFTWQNNSSAQCYLIRHGDTVLIDRGYHPTVTSPGHKLYIFTILVGHTRSSLIQNFHEIHRHLLQHIPGIGAMRDKFKK
ncbi:MAG: 5-deoxy-glucuronate isomerase [Sedimentisphaerales bacterium]|nr:5-deoxy-glucuronate isomerase [Sedimentisphaerales bacterium]